MITAKNYELNVIQTFAKHIIRLIVLLKYDRYCVI